MITWSQARRPQRDTTQQADKSWRRHAPIGWFGPHTAWPASINNLLYSSHCFTASILRTRHRACAKATGTLTNAPAARGQADEALTSAVPMVSICESPRLVCVCCVLSGLYTHTSSRHRACAKATGMLTNAPAARGQADKRCPYGLNLRKSASCLRILRSIRTLHTP
jgi:hypothetical protein